jgi:hypothetical protein
VFDTAKFDEVSTYQSTFTELKATIPDSIVATESIATKGITTIPESLAFSEVNKMQITSTIQESVIPLDFIADGFDFGVFDTLTFDKPTGNTAWTKLIFTILDSVSIALERIYTEGQVQYNDNLNLTDAVVSHITATIQESLNLPDVVVIKLIPPIQTDSFSLADLSSTVLIHTIIENMQLSESEATKIVATIREQLTNHEAVSTRVIVSATDSITLTEFLSMDYLLVLLSYMNDSVLLISKIR